MVECTVGTDRYLEIDSDVREAVSRVSSLNSGRRDVPGGEEKGGTECKLPVANARQLEAYFSARPAYFIFSTLLRPLHADAAAMARSRSAAGPLPTRAEKSESGRASSSAG